MPTQSPANPFRLLDLPLEIRYIIYEHIAITTHRHLLISRDASGNLAMTALIWKGVPASLLATSHQLNAEATPFFAPKFAKIRNEPIRIMVDAAASKALVSDSSPLIACFGLKMQPLLRPYKGPLRLPGTPPVPRPTRPKLVTGQVSGHPVENNLDGLNIAAPARPAPDASMLSRFEDTSGFIKRCTRMLTYTRTAPLSPTRSFDIEILLNEDMEHWTGEAMHSFFFAVSSICRHTGLAIAVIGRDKREEYASGLRVPGPGMGNALDVWHVCRLSAELRFMGLRRPELALLGFPLGERVKRDWMSGGEMY